MVDPESRWSVSIVCKFGLLDALKLCLAPEYAWDTMEMQSHHFESDLRHTTRGFWIALGKSEATRNHSSKERFECSEQVGPGGRPVCGRQARRRFEP